MKTVLVVDDEPVLRVLVREILQEEGYAVIDASDGRSMLELLDGVHPDLVLMDVMMPGIDGREAYKVLRSRTDLVVPSVTRVTRRARGDRHGVTT